MQHGVGGRVTRGRWMLLMALLGATTSALLGSGLIAVVTDSATSIGNSVESAELAAGAADLRAGLLPNGEPCGAETTTNDTTFPAIIESENLQMVRNTPAASARVCLYNAGSSTGSAYMQFTSVLDAEANTEPGTCDNAEALPQGGNDQSCGANAAGELSEVLDGYVVFRIPCPQECVHPRKSFRFDDVNTDTLSLFELAAGDALVIDLYLFVSEQATDAQLQAAQTDRLQFDIAFTFDDQETTS